MSQIHTLQSLHTSNNQQDMHENSRRTKKTISEQNIIHIFITTVASIATYTAVTLLTQYKWLNLTVKQSLLITVTVASIIILTQIAQSIYNKIKRKNENQFTPKKIAPNLNSNPAPTITPIPTTINDELKKKLEKDIEKLSESIKKIQDQRDLYRKEIEQKTEDLDSITKKYESIVQDLRDDNTRLSEKLTETTTLLEEAQLLLEDDDDEDNE